jgi:predicted alpha/beta superfamily hydrolase
MTDSLRYAPTGDDHSLTGDFHMYYGFRSRFLEHERNVLVYLPPGYSENETKRYPVLYMNDGQNMFDGATSFVRGEDWGLDETADELIREKAIEPLIMVAVYNTGNERIDEYTPTVDPKLKKGGRADLYCRLLVEELKPLIDASYRTHVGPGYTAIGGSSLGGLVSIHLALKHPHVFGKVMAMSPSVWWDRAMIVERVRSLAIKPSTRIWLDIGTKEGVATTRNVRLLRDALTRKGWRANADLGYYEDKHGTHNELSWGRRANRALRYLFAR